MSKNSIIPFLKDYLINFLTSPFLLDTNVKGYKIDWNFLYDILIYRIPLFCFYF